jgi:putative (di)nucleoside polyphosphate hydrolase
MYRELYEETGLREEHVKMLGSTAGWLRYQLPRRFQRTKSKPLCIGQKQVWFLLKLIDDSVKFNFKVTPEPEFRDFRWVDFWYPADNVIRFKRRVYRQALTLLEPLVESG